MQSSAPIDVTIVVVSYNTRGLTLACLDSIAAETRDNGYFVRVVDNASSDGSADAVRAHAIGADVIASHVNLGFARANNLAATRAVGEFILLLNPDTVVRNGAVDRLVAFARATPDAGIWGGRTVFPDGALNPPSCWGRMTPWNLLCRAIGLTGMFPRSTLFNGEAYGGCNRDAIRRVDIVSGCFLLIRRSLWERLGGFDPAFFMYGEEADLCLRAYKLGARPLITPAATIIHLGGASERTRAGKMVKLLAAKITLIRRHWHPVLQPLGLALTAAWPLSRWLALAARSAVRPNTASSEAAATWRDIWRARASWLPGYTTPAAIPDVAALASTNS
jgi:N-acetylglucosaminyl-diphospho-decaprenol L-rhamnosyltransferase